MLEFYGDGKQRTAGALDICNQGAAIVSAAEMLRKSFPDLTAAEALAVASEASRREIVLEMERIGCALTDIATQLERLADADETQCNGRGRGVVTSVRW